MNMFLSGTREWFQSCIGTPTTVQALGWQAIASGKDALISAPTGSGKTLAAFLYFLDRFARQNNAGTLREEVSVLYISPLKALGNDINANLKRPLAGLGLSGIVKTAVRNGDTEPGERARMAKHPPNILITTPESMYLLLSSASGRRMLRTVTCAILDEFHATVSSKRGTHLMLSLARLDALCERRVQRIALSATIRPLEEAKKHLSGDAECEIIAPETEKKTELIVDTALRDMRVLPEHSVWPALADRVIEQLETGRTLLAFTDGRAGCERLAQKINERAGENIARTHHGCVSKEQRLEAEQMLKSGALRVMAATSSMELGIDVGEIDQVIQIGNPFGVAPLLQRMGRAGHAPGRVSRMRVYPKTASEALYCALTARAAAEKQIESIHAPEMCADLLAQHLVSMAAAGCEISVSEAAAILSRAYAYRNLTEEDVRETLRMLAGDYEHDDEKPVHPRVIYNRLTDTFSGDNYTKMLAFSSGGTIPDRGWFAVTLPDGTHLGELDEEYVFEARLGDKFLLGAFPWKIIDITKDRVIVEKTTPSGAVSPFWKGDGAMRAYETGVLFGKYAREINEKAFEGTRALEAHLMRMHLTPDAAKNAARVVEEQLSVTGKLSDDTTIIIEHFRDEAGDHQLMVHSVFGGQVNRALGMLLSEAAAKAAGTDARTYDDDDGILIYLLGGKEIPHGLFSSIHPETAEAKIRAMLPATPMFSMVFRYNAQRAMLMGARSGRRLPLWIQRIRSSETLSRCIQHAEHPIIKESIRECTEYHMDLASVKDVLSRIRSGRISVIELDTEKPSPLSLNLRRQVEAELMYETVIPTAAIHKAQEDAISISPEKNVLSEIYEEKRELRSEEELHTRFMTEGDMLSEEIPAPGEWAEALLAAGRLSYIEPGLWIAKEHEGAYGKAFSEGDDEAFRAIVRRLCRYQGAQNADSIAERYAVSIARADAALKTLFESGALVEWENAYCHRDVYASAQRRTLALRRRQVETAPSSAYADAIASCMRPSAAPREQLSRALKMLSRTPYPPEAWEEYLLPARVTGYRPQRLDDALAAGEAVYRIHAGEKTMISFEMPEDAEGGESPSPEHALSEDAGRVLAFLNTRGASFARVITAKSGAASAHDALRELMACGLVRADSFIPVREWLMPSKNTLKSGVRSRVRAMDAGRWEAAACENRETEENALNRIFERSLIACRETAQDAHWPALLALLRRMEYAGKVRRGYFVQGLSGAQFVREEDFIRISALLSSPSGECCCLAACDPAQVWGSCFPHAPGRAFLRIPSNAVILFSGTPAAVFEKHGEVLRIFDAAHIENAVKCFQEAWKTCSVFSHERRITVRQYPKEAESALESAGFVREALDYVLYKE